MAAEETETDEVSTASSAPTNSWFYKNDGISDTDWCEAYELYDEDEGEFCVREISPDLVPMSGFIKTRSRFDDMTVIELKLELRRRWYRSNGLKDECLEAINYCLRQALFSQGARWRELTPRQTVSESFDVPAFSGTEERYSYRTLRSGKRIVNTNKYGRPLMENVPRPQEGLLKVPFLDEHMLCIDTKPHEYADLFIPLLNPMESEIHDPVVAKFHWIDFDDEPRSYNANDFTFETIAKWTNQKPEILSGEEGPDKYPNFVPFTAEEIRKHLAVCLWQGLASSSRFGQQTFSPDVPHFVNEVIGDVPTRGYLRHEEFKMFFTLQDLTKSRHSRKEHPNHKVKPILERMNYIFPRIMRLGEHISLETRSMASPSPTRPWMIGYDSFDALYQDGFCYQLHFRNDCDCGKVQLRFGLSPVHARCVSLFDSLEDSHHKCTVKNPCYSAAFCRAAFDHKRKVVCHGRVEDPLPLARGIPRCILQKPVESRRELIAVQGTVKAAVLQDDKVCPNIVATSTYENHGPVYYLSTATEKIKWVENKTTNVHGRKEAHQSLRIEPVDERRENSDKRIDPDAIHFDRSWLKERKWWWSIAFSAIEVMLSNAYVVYVKVNKDCGNTDHLLPKEQFLWEIIAAWMGSTGENETPKTKKRNRFDDMSELTHSTTFVSMCEEESSSKSPVSSRPNSNNGSQNSEFSPMKPEMLYTKKRRMRETPSVSDSRNIDDVFNHIDATMTKQETPSVSDSRNSDNAFDINAKMTKLENHTPATSDESSFTD